MERNTNPNGAIRRPRERDEPVRPLIERYRADTTIADTFPEEYRLLLRLHYIDYLSWEQTADTMHYSVENIYKLRLKALELLKQTIEVTHNV